jgi:hypothetical protein
MLVNKKVGKTIDVIKLFIHIYSESNEQQLNVFMKQLNNLKQQVETYKQQL